MVIGFEIVESFYCVSCLLEFIVEFLYVWFLEVWFTLRVFITVKAIV
jgi:hypothetical protein